MASKSSSAASDVIEDVDFLEEMLEDAMLLVYGGTDARGEVCQPAKGIAALQARKHLMLVKAQLDAARKHLALATGGDGSEEAFLADFDERLRNLPTPYLERAVTEYLTRHPGVRLVGGS